MAGYSYNPDMHAVPLSPTDETIAEGRPALDYSLPPPPPVSALVEQLNGTPATPGSAFTRRVSPTGQSDVPDPGV